MAKPLDPKAIEAERQTSSRAERREQKRRQEYQNKNRVTSQKNARPKARKDRLMERVELPIVESDAYHLRLDYDHRVR